MEGERGTDDLAGLKSALASERQANKEARARIRELETNLDEFDTLKGQLESITKERDAFKFRETRREVFEKAVNELRATGEWDIDTGKARTLVEKFTGDDIEKNIQDAIEILKFKPTKPEGEPKRVINGQPDNSGGASAVDPAKVYDLGKLYRENRPAYDALMAQRRKQNRFLNQVT